MSVLLHRSGVLSRLKNTHEKRYPTGTVNDPATRPWSFLPLPLHPLAVSRHARPQVQYTSQTFFLPSFPSSFFPPSFFSCIFLPPSPSHLSTLLFFLSSTSSSLFVAILLYFSSLPSFPLSLTLCPSKHFPSLSLSLFLSVCLVMSRCKMFVVLAH